MQILWLLLLYQNMYAFSNFLIKDCKDGLPSRVSTQQPVNNFSKITCLKTLDILPKTSIVYWSKRRDQTQLPYFRATTPSNWFYSWLSRQVYYSCSNISVANYFFLEIYVTSEGAVSHIVLYFQLLISTFFMLTCILSNYQ